MDNNLNEYLSEIRNPNALGKVWNKFASKWNEYQSILHNLKGGGGSEISHGLNNLDIKDLKPVKSLSNADVIKYGEDFRNIYDTAKSDDKFDCQIGIDDELGIIVVVFDYKSPSIKSTTSKIKDIEKDLTSKLKDNVLGVNKNTNQVALAFVDTTKTKSSDSDSDTRSNNFNKSGILDSNGNTMQYKSEGFIDRVTNYLERGSNSEEPDNSMMEYPVGCTFIFTINSKGDLPSSFDEEDYEYVKKIIFDEIYEALDDYLSGKVFDDEYYRIDMEDGFGSFDKEVLSVTVVCDKKYMTFVDSNKLKDIIDHTIINYNGLKLASRVKKVRKDYL